MSDEPQYLQRRLDDPTLSVDELRIIVKQLAELEAMIVSALSRGAYLEHIATHINAPSVHQTLLIVRKAHEIGLQFHDEFTYP